MTWAMFSPRQSKWCTISSDTRNKTGMPASARRPRPATLITFHTRLEEEFGIARQWDRSVWTWDTTSTHLLFPLQRPRMGRCPGQKCSEGLTFSSTSVRRSSEVSSPTRVRGADGRCVPGPGGGPDGRRREQACDHGERTGSGGADRISYAGQASGQDHPGGKAGSPRPVDRSLVAGTTDCNHRRTESHI